MIHLQRILFFTVLVLGITISVIGFMLLSLPIPLKAGSSDNVTGWAWAGIPQSVGGEKLGLGWISFNGDNEPGGQDYGVNIELDGNLTGYAYYDMGSGNIGWIDFDPAVPNLQGNSDYSARVDLNTGELSGWARTIEYDGGWDGWIKLSKDSIDSGQDYGVYIDTNDGEFHGWAWGDDVMGWISFNCDNPEGPDSCASTNNYHVQTSFSFVNPPQATNFSTATSPNYCLNTPTQGLAWDYAGDAPQKAYKIEFKYQGGSVFKTIERNSSSDTSAIKITTSPDINQLEVDFNGSYEFRVMVQDENDAWSAWSNVVNFNSTEHAWPDVSFNYEPAEPIAEEVVIFTDTSTVYGGTFKSSILWEFDRGDPLTASGNTATTTFSAGIDRLIKLTVTDSHSFVCEKELLLDINYPMPGWTEE